LTGLTCDQEQALKVARALATAGIPVFVAPEDWPEVRSAAVKGWQTTTPNPAYVDAWQPRKRLCAVMGHGLDLVDLDTRNGGDVAKLNGGMPTVYGVASTPSGGWHGFIKSLGVRSRDGVLPGIDVKAGDAQGQGRGFAFIAPTVKPSKVTGELRAYQWVRTPDLDALMRAADDRSGEKLAAMVRAAHGSTRGGQGEFSWDEFKPSPWDDIAEALSVESGGRRLGVYKLACALRGRGGWRVGDALAYMRTTVWPLVDQHQSGHPLTEDEFDTAVRDAFTRHEDGPSSGGKTPTEPADADGDLWHRPELGHIRNLARARMAPPVAVLVGVLARVICRTPEWVTLPSLIFSPASLNLAIAIVGESGAGKSGATRVAAEAVQMSGGCDFKTHSIGTGQGLAHAYARFDNKEGVVRTAYSAMLILDEVAHLAGHARQSGSTILAELRRFLMGEPLGHLYVDLYKRVELPAHSYRGAVIIGVQPAKADALLDDVDAGTPQRFGWFPATDPTAGDDMPDCPEPLGWQAPDWDRRQAGPDRLLHLRVCDEAATAIREAHRQRARGEGDPLDGHRLLTRERFAAGFALLAGHAHTAGITADDWALAGTLLAVSDRTRAQVVDRLTRARTEQNRQRGEAEAERAAIIGERTADAELKRACQYITRKLSREADWVNGGPLRASLPGPLRPWFDAAIDVLTEAGQVETEHTAGNHPGSRYRLADKATS
jgi:hypothetical protein